MLKDIRTLDSKELHDEVVAMGEKPFRAKQLEDWVWSKSAGSFEEMTSLSKTFREKLAEKFILKRIELSEQQISRDGTVKCAFKVDTIKSGDLNIIEGVLIPTKSRTTACISSQVGCSLACDFCATGRLKLMKNLTAAEMYDQVEMIATIARERERSNLSNIVYMGMGEPLLNYKHVLESVKRICGTPGLGMSPRRITISTAGIAKAIKRLGDDEVKFNLALSLHAANDKKRSEIMAINDSNNLESLAEALRYFHEKTGSRVTFEYIIFRDFNDGIEDAQELAIFCKNVPCKINIIEYNPIDDGRFQQAEPEKVDAFKDFLEERNLIVNVRRSRGKDIDAACGQLANKNASGKDSLRKS
ncbi:MAG: 23S rRNA (adenine(2503)-C(2))-methyltransferase RlmN [Bacteroidetes bacterium]|jgi:23S rRNA (adenine2503-C2)-methyltransferase|nr:23S rRNA (adenine(2503)-C(2))-methyltransferase RlmN [Bacteroidota bacterium]MDA0980395.1 23S rRNA (adenine(2503)-C(2))-methyltransferase RlmN [Bacteroidota bacterium]